VYGKVIAYCRPDEDADGALLPLLRKKRPRERQMLRRSAKILSEAVAALKADGVIAAERRARASQAQDFRILFGDQTLKPFETPDDLKARPTQAYVAVRYLGYWTEAFVTLGDNAPAQAALDAMIEVAKPGATGRDLARAAGAAPHPMLGNRIGHGIGLSLDEAPVLAADSDAALEDGGVYALHVGVGGAFASAVIAPGNEILWRG